MNLYGQMLVSKYGRVNGSCVRNGSRNIINISCNGVLAYMRGSVKVVGCYRHQKVEMYSPPETMASEHDMLPVLSYIPHTTTETYDLQSKITCTLILIMLLLDLSLNILLFYNKIQILLSDLTLQ